jgi:hypothetical protein
MSVSFDAVSNALRGSVPAAGLGMSVSGSGLGIGDFITMDGLASYLYVSVIGTGSNGMSAPVGSYRARFTFVNVGSPVTVNLTSGTSTTAACPLAANPGYNNAQTCDLVVQSSGAAFAVTARMSTNTQLTVRGVEVTKER